MSVSMYVSKSNAEIAGTKAPEFVLSFLFLIRNMNYLCIFLIRTKIKSVKSNKGRFTI